MKCDADRLFAVEELHARGNRSITATHSSTLEISRAGNRTLNADCVIAASTTKGLRDLPAEFSKICANDSAKIIMEIRVAGIKCITVGKGSSALTLNHPYDMVTRKSYMSQIGLL